MKMSKAIKIAAVLAGALAVSACGQKVEVPSGHVAKVFGTTGYNEGIIPTSKFRLDKCWGYCDKLVLLNVSDQTVTETLELLMPQDKLLMKFNINMTLTVNPKKYEMIFANIPSSSANNQDYISIGQVYETYAKQIIRTESREFLSKYKIEEITSSLEAINVELANRLVDSISTKTPFVVRYAGISDVKYPKVITTAQENSAERREMIEQEEAQLEVSIVQLEREHQEQVLRRKIDVEKAEAEAEINRILAESITPEYRAYRSLQIMEKIADSDNKVFMPVDMLSSVAGQVNLGNTK